MELAAALDPTSDAYKRAVADLSRESLHFFTRRMFKARKGYKWADNWHHRAICDALERVFRGECTRLIINIPPRYSKTEIAVVNFIAWALGHYPDAEFIHTSYSGTLAVNNAAMAKSVVESDEYREIFPDVTLSRDSKAKGDWRTTEGGVVYAQGSGGTITGFGAGKMRPGFGGAIIIDDPHKADEARSDTIRKSVIEWFGNTLESRKNDPARTPIILIMQRLHEADLAGFLLAGGNGEKWEHVCLSAITDDGKALWPAKHTLEQLQVMERANPYVFAGQYRQRPAPLAGGIFKPDMLRVVDAVPVGTQFVRGWDFAGTADGGDWTVGLKLGVQPSGRYIIAGVARDQLDPDKVEELLKNMAVADGTACEVVIPQDPGQAGKAQARTFTKLLGGFTVKSQPVSGDKVLRAGPFAAQVNVGNVDILRGDWNDPLTSEMRTFPNGKHDDQIDAASTAFDRLTSTPTGMLDYYRQQAEEAARLRAASEAPAKPPASDPSAWMAQG